jgi:hypothetical protein
MEKYGKDPYEELKQNEIKFAEKIEKSNDNFKRKKELGYTSMSNFIEENQFNTLTEAFVSFLKEIYQEDTEIVDILNIILINAQKNCNTNVCNIKKKIKN